MADEPEYRIPSVGAATWRGLRTEESHRPAERDVAITGVETTLVAGNFTWGLVEVETDAGLTGLGEFHGSEAAAAAVAGMEAHLEGQNPLDAHRLYEHLYAGQGATRQTALAAVETALWDLKGKLFDVPVYELLGGKFRDRIRIYNDTHGGAPYGTAASSDPDEIYTPEALAAAARDVVDDGFTGLKFDLDLPTGMDADPASRRFDRRSIDHKVALVEAVRDEIGYEVDLGVDLHGNFTVETAIRLGEKLEPFDLAWYEDPVPTEKHAAHRRVREKVAIPIMTGETVTAPQGFLDLLSADALDIAQPDVNLSGGLGNLARIASLCDMHGVPLTPHNVGSPVATVAGAHLCAAIPNFLALEFHSREVPWWDDLVTRTAGSGPIIEDGFVDLPEGPGLGIELDREVVAERRIGG